MDESKSKTGMWTIIGVAVLVICLSPLLGVVGIASLVSSGDDCAADSPGVGEGAQDLKSGEVPEEYVEDVKKASKESGIPASILAAQIEQESQWNPKACSGAGACGIAQFIPSTWEKYSHGASTNDGHAGIRAQGEYMRDLMETVAGVSKSAGKSQTDLALAAYNAGEGAVLSNHGIPPYPETTEYVEKITGNAKSYSIDGDDSKNSDAKDDDSKSKSEESSGSKGGKPVGQCKDSSGSDEGGKYTGGEISGTDDFPWKDADTASVNETTQFYYRQCVDFAMWRVNQQVGATDPEKPKFTNNKGPWGHLGNGLEWAAAWKSGGWPADTKPEVGAVAHFDPGVTGAGDIGHVAVVKEIKGDQVEIEEYNAMVPYGYDTRTIPADGVSTYLHIPQSERAEK